MIDRVISKLGLGMFALVVFAFVPTPCLIRATEAAESQRRPQKSRSQKRPVPPKPKVDYTRFSHQTHVVTQKLACNSCHKVPSKNWKEVRKGDAAFADVTDFPEHSSCLTCHRERFFARERPAPAICSNCHIAISPRDTARWLFPSLGDLTDPKLKRREFVSEFGVGFPHDKHIDVVGLNVPASPNRGLFVNALFRYRTGSGSDRVDPDSGLTLGTQEKKPAPPKSCPVCHETYQPQGKSSEEFVTKPPKNIGDNFWLKKGTFKTIPNSHTVCFTCHNADSGLAPEPKNCDVCHKLVSPMQLKVDFDPKLPGVMGVTDKMILGRWSRRISAGAFRHEGGEHPDLSCLNCHNVASPTFSTMDPKTLKVAVRSCGGAEGCHATATADEGGALNFEIDERKKNPNFVCTKCHITFGKEPIPENHPQAIPTPKPKAKPS
jgi:hypothetical protein